MKLLKLKTQEVRQTLYLKLYISKWTPILMSLIIGIPTMGLLMGFQIFAFVFIGVTFLSLMASLLGLFFTVKEYNHRTRV